MQDSPDDLPFDMPSVWRWLRARPAFAPLGPPPALAEPARFTVEAGGDLLVTFGGSLEFALRFSFPPAPAGQAAVEVGTHMQVPLSVLGPLIEVASRQLETSAAPIGPAAQPSEALVGVHLTRCSTDGAASVLGHVQLFELDKPRVSLSFDFGFVDEGGDDGFKRGAGWFHFRGPRGKKSRETVVRFLAEMFAPSG